MTNPNYVGKHFKLDDNILTVMDLTGWSKGATWVFDYAEIRPEPVLSRVMEAINDDITAGREHLIHHVLVSNRYALILYLEGVITRQHFEQCTEGDDYIEMTVELNRVPRLLRIQSEYDLDYNVCTVDAKGEIV